MQYLISIILALACLTAHAEDKEWGKIATIENGPVIAGRYGSYERNDSSGSLLIRFTRNSQITFYIASITDQECVRGYGKVLFSDTSRSVITRENYVRNGGNGISAIGDVLCLLQQKTKGQTL